VLANRDLLSLPGITNKLPSYQVVEALGGWPTAGVGFPAQCLPFRAVPRFLGGDRRRSSPMRTGKYLSISSTRIYLPHHGRPIRAGLTRHPSIFFGAFARRDPQRSWSGFFS
jgi:hypothetical protein